MEPSFDASAIGGIQDQGDSSGPGISSTLRSDSDIRPEFCGFSCILCLASDLRGCAARRFVNLSCMFSEALRWPLRLGLLSFFFAESVHNSSVSAGTGSLWSFLLACLEVQLYVPGLGAAQDRTCVKLRFGEGNSAGGFPKEARWTNHTLNTVDSQEAVFSFPHEV